MAKKSPGLGACNQISEGEFGLQQLVEMQLVETVRGFGEGVWRDLSKRVERSLEGSLGEGLTGQSLVKS